MSSAPASLAQRPSTVPAHVALLAVQTCFGLFPIFGKWAFVPGAFAPFAVGVWRMLFASLSLLLGAWLTCGPRWIPERRDFGRLALCALLGVTVNMTLYLEGLKRSTAVNAGLVMCLIPVFTFAIAAAVKLEEFRWTRTIGLAIALLGASLLFWAERPELVREHGLGNALMALNTLSYASYLVLVRPLMRRYPPLAVIAWVFTLSLPFVPLLVWRETATSALAPLDAVREFFAPSGAGARPWLSLAFILVFPTSLAYFLNAFALSRVRASTTAVYVYLQFLITVVAGAVALHEELTAIVIASAAMVCAGIWLVARREAPRAAPLDVGGEPAVRS